MASKAANVENVTFEHNVKRTFLTQGLRIHIKFDISNAKDKPCRIWAFFHDESGNRLSKAVAVEDFKPSYENTTYYDLKLFIPNSLFKESGLSSRAYTLSLILSIYCGNEHITNSKKYYLGYSNSKTHWAQPPTTATEVVVGGLVLTVGILAVSVILGSAVAFALQNGIPLLISITIGGIISLAFSFNGG